MRAVALIALVACLGCHDNTSPVNPTTASSSVANVPMTLSGTIFEVPHAVKRPFLSALKVMNGESGHSRQYPDCILDVQDWIQRSVRLAPVQQGQHRRH